jgi:hypothetical protein
MVMDNGSYIQLILDAFTFMDIVVLRNQLKDENSYQGKERGGRLGS